MGSRTPAQQAALKRILDRAATRTRREEIEEDLVHERGLSPEEKDRRLQSVVRAGHEILASRTDRDRVLAWEEPPAADFPAIWARLVERRRARSR
jgi:hypothetical protein